MTVPEAGRPRVAVLLPALNEESALPLVLADLAKVRGQGVPLDEVLVVDNGSTDRTAQVAREAGARVLHEPRRGYGRACLSGIDLLLGRCQVQNGELPLEALGSLDWIVFLDADHSDFPEDLGSILAPLEQNRADLVIGSRVLGGAGMQALLPQAWFGNRLACTLMLLLFGARYTDLGPFRAIRVEALEHLQMGDEDYGWTVEMQLKARVAQLRCTEVPVRYRARVGESKITGTWRGTLGAAYKILGWIFGWRLRLWLSPRCIPKYPRSPHSESR